MNCIENYLKMEHLHSDKPAIVFFKGLKSLDHPKSSITFKELYKRTVIAQEYFKAKGIGKGDAVLLFELPGPNLYAVLLAILGLGGQLLLVEPWMPAEKINKILEKVKPKAFMRSWFGRLWALKAKETKNIPLHFSSSEIFRNTENFDLSDKDFHVEDMDPDDHAILTFTTGTSGNPKGVHRKHQYLLDQGEVLKKYLHYDQYPKMDLTVFTNIVLINLTLGKGSLVLPPKWPKKVLAQLDKLPEKYQVDTVACGPAFLLKLFRAAKVKTLKSFHLGGALTDCWIYEQALEHWPKAKFDHVYGSSEAEPVGFCDLREAVSNSREQGFFQTLCLGRTVTEIKTMDKGQSLWVSGPHVSPMYQGDEAANKKNKFLDDKGVVWHNMGDRIKEIEGLLWYRGRDFQKEEDFLLEQKVYVHLQSSKSFIHRLGDKVILIGEDLHHRKIELFEKFPEIKRIEECKIFRDVRHRARIDRNKSLEILKL